MSSIVTLVLKYLPYLVQASASIPQVMDFITGIQEIFKRDKVWTTEEEKAFDDSLEALRKDPYWQPSE